MTIHLQMVDPARLPRGGGGLSDVPLAYPIDDEDNKWSESDNNSEDLAEVKVLKVTD